MTDGLTKLGRNRFVNDCASRHPGTQGGRWTLLMGVAMLMSACSVMPAYERPEAPIAALYPSAPMAEAPTMDAVQSPQSDLPAWEEWVGDDRLRELVKLALANNRDLRLASLNVQQLQAQYAIQRAGQWPSINLSVSGNRVPTASGGTSSTYTAGVLVSSWELDLFGRIASLKEAALSQFLASEEARNGVQSSLVATVVSTWLSLQSNEQLLSLARRTVDAREDSLRLVRLRFDSGATSALDLRQAESLAAASRATLAQLQRARAQDLNALALLVGTSVRPDLLPAANGSSSEVPAIPAGLPSSLLERRPDIRQAEQQLKAANANIGAARAAFFPRISLTAGYGSVSTELSGLFKDGSWGYTLAPQALVPIFAAGRNQANLDAAWVGRDAAVAQYEKAIQSAFREVADALAAQSTLSAQLAALREQVDAESERLRLSDLRYANGVASYLDVLDAQRSLFNAEQAVVQTRLAVMQSRVQLYKALGGGWTAEGNS